MVEIISKREGMRREDAQMKRLLADNRATITRIADHISNGAYSASKAPRPAPRAQGLIIHHAGAAAPKHETRPQVRISPNGRVIVFDQNSARQLHHLGELRRREGVDVFALATSENGFFAPLEDGMAQALADLDGCRITAVGGEDGLAAELGRRLGIE